MAEVIDQLKKGLLSPSQAVDSFECGDTVLLGDIPTEDIYTEALDCGFPTLNHHLVFKKHRGDLIVLGALQGHGKSAMMMQVARHIAQTAGHVLVFSTEMGRPDLLTRILTEQTRYSAYELTTGQVDRQKVRAAHEKLGGVPLAINIRDSSDIASLTRVAAAVHRRTPLSLVAVDYIQNVSGSVKGNRQAEVAGVSSELKQLAMRLNCPVLALAQVNRGPVQRGWAAMNYGKEPSFIPTLYDLKDSGGIGNDADVALFISRHEEHMRGKRVGEVDIVLAKHRSGATGSWIWKWDGSRCRFTDPKQQQEVEGF